MKISEQAQEQLEQLWLLSQENGQQLPHGLGIAEEFAGLIELELAQIDGEQLFLTTVGFEQAALAIRRHRLAERLFTDVLATETSLIDEKACTLEHALFDGVDETICTLLGHPTSCPHGKPIPPGRCCRQGRDSLSPLITSLKELKRGQGGHIAYIHMQNPQRLHKLMAMGIFPGTEIRVKETYPSFVFEAGYSQFAVDEEIAGDIFIRSGNSSGLPG
jgi:DtxR family Mn-dependent transcriptional regulator